MNYLLGGGRSLGPFELDPWEKHRHVLYASQDVHGEHMHILTVELLLF